MLFLEKWQNLFLSFPRKHGFFSAVHTCTIVHVYIYLTQIRIANGHTAIFDISKSVVNTMDCKEADQLFHTNEGSEEDQAVSVSSQSLQQPKAALQF